MLSEPLLSVREGEESGAVAKNVSAPTHPPKTVSGKIRRLKRAVIMGGRETIGIGDDKDDGA